MVSFPQKHSILAIFKALCPIEVQGWTWEKEKAFKWLSPDSPIHSHPCPSLVTNSDPFSFCSSKWAFTDFKRLMSFFYKEFSFARDFAISNATPMGSLPAQCRPFGPQIPKRDFPLKSIMKDWVWPFCKMSRSQLGPSNKSVIKATKAKTIFKASSGLRDIKRWPEKAFKTRD